MTKRINHIFDGLLQKQKIIQTRDFSRVHNWMDDYYKLCSWQGSIANRDTNEIRSWILGKSNERDPEVLTDYLRVALGHMLLVALSEGFAFKNEYELMKMAFQTYLDREYQNVITKNESATLYC